MSFTANTFTSREENNLIKIKYGLAHHISTRTPLPLDQNNYAFILVPFIHLRYRIYFNIILNYIRIILV